MSERPFGDDAARRGFDPSLPDDADLETLGEALAHEFVQRLREGRSRDPGRSFLFPKIDDAGTRRQVVRWFGREYDEPTPGILEVLRSALTDRDWEVRVSAMLVAARLSAARVRSLVKEVPLPAAHQYGLSELDVRLLIALRAMSTELLDRSELADRARVDGEAVVGVPADLVRQVLDRGRAPRNGAELFIHALVEPHELEEPLPEPLPDGITRHERRFFLGDAIEMVWVSPTTHLLGGASDTPIRAFVPGQGFFAARRPITATALSTLGISAPAFDPSSAPSIAERIGLTPDPPAPMSHAEALEVCEAIARRTGAAVTLPSADELECAARGTDGRRYSWGNGIEQLTGNERTPHGLERFAVPAPQWTSSLDDRGAPLVLGGVVAAACAARVPWREAAGMRPIVRVGQ